MSLVMIGFVAFGSTRRDPPEPPDARPAPAAVVLRPLIRLPRVSVPVARACRLAATSGAALATVVFLHGHTRAEAPPGEWLLLVCMTLWLAVLAAFRLETSHAAV
jgi:hypothetical protein